MPAAYAVFTPMKAHFITTFTPTPVYDEYDAFFFAGIVYAGYMQTLYYRHYATDYADDTYARRRQLYYAYMPRCRH